MKKNALIIAAIMGTLLVTACEKRTPTPEQAMKAGEKLAIGQEVSFKTVEEQRAQGRANATATAAEYQRQNPRILGWETIVKADTTHSSRCPQGDGWAEVVFMRTEREAGNTKNLQIEKASVMCSTVSRDQGCVMFTPVDNWSKHPGKMQDGHCASTHEVPFPLPNVVGAK